MGGGLSLWTESGVPLLPLALVIGPGLLIVAARFAWAGHRRVAMIVALCGAVTSGLTQAQAASMRAWSPPGLDVEALERRSQQDDVVVIEGVLRHDAAPSAFGASLDLRVDTVVFGDESVRTDMGIRVSVGGEHAAASRHEWTRGRRIRAPVSGLRRPLPYRNFGVADAERELSRRHVRMFGGIKSAALVEWEAGPWWEEAAARVRAAVRSAVRRATSDDTTAAVVIAILIGDRTGLSPDEERRLQQAGTYHVIAISGGNVALFLGALAWVPRWRRAGVRVGTAMIAVALLLFAVCVDGGASVWRASLVAALWLASRWWDLRTSALQATAGAAALILLADPLALHDPGFLLSFGATLALIVMSLRLQASYRQNLAAPPHGHSALRRCVTAVSLVVLATASVELLLLPIGARWFSLVTGVGLVANLFALPAMATVQAAGMGLVVLDACGATRVAELAGVVASLGVRVLVGSGALVDVLPALVRYVPPPPLISLVAYYAALGLAVWASWPDGIGEARRATASTSAALAIGLLGFFVWGWPANSAAQPWSWGVASRVQTATWPRDEWLVLTTLDVGQGDATVLRFPGGRTWLIDAGGASPESTFDLGARVTSQALWALGLRRLDRLVLTHGDADHGGGVPAVIERFRPREVLVGIPVPSDPVDADVLGAAERFAVSVRAVRTGDHFADGRVSVRVLHPPAPDWERVKVRNDDSVVLWVRYGDVGILLPGDAGTDVEGTWVPQVAAQPLVVLRAGHHGSRTSSGARLQHHLQPDVVVTSSGRGNRFGHPHPDVIRRATGLGADIWRTDVDGAVQVATNGHVLVVRSASGRVDVIAGS